MAPFGAEGLDWFAGMSDSGVASLRAAAEVRAAKKSYEASGAGYDPKMCTPEDHAALSGAWAWLLEAGAGWLIDDLDYVAPWGFDPARVAAPALLLHGCRDRVVPSSHGEWLAHGCPSAQLWLSPHEGHISVLHCGAASMEWLREHADEV